MTKSLVEWEATVSQFNYKSCRFDRFMEYIEQKNYANSIVGEVYHQKIFRKLRWWAEINRTRSEAKMIQRFKSVIGDPSQVVIGIGDWEQRKRMKFKEPTKGKGLRILFKKAGYKVFLIDEFRTSCCCFNCKKAEKTVETFRWCRNPRPWKRHEMSIRHGLTMCKSCESLWNRDRNASLNMLAVMEAYINGEDRQEYLQRPKIDKGSKKMVSRRKSSTSQKLSPSTLV
ncbi:hypothetical protein P9112_003437 [Eukaryota sp. TZLM1-RC]